MDKLNVSIALLILLVGVVLYKMFRPTYETYNSKKLTKKQIEMITKFFRENPYPTDKKVHRFAKKMGINKHSFEEMIYAMLTDTLNK